MTDDHIHSGNHYFSQYPILPTVTSSIVIPVKDEEGYILRTLQPFCEQVDRDGESLDLLQFEILVLANNCTDSSVKLIKDFQLENPFVNLYLQEITLTQEKANIGYVRRKLMDCAYSRLIRNGGGIIMTTDADTTVSRDWITQTKLEIENGAEAVGGRILLYPDELDNLDEFTRQHHLNDEKYQLLISALEGIIVNPEHDPAPRHHQHFNGSFAITSESYERSGGVPDVTHLEDCAFYDRLEKIDTKFRHSHKVIVQTSARCIGRAEIGLSYQLNEWKNLGLRMEDFLVEPSTSIIRRLTLKRFLMDLWNSKNLMSKSDFFEKTREMVPEIFFDDEIFDWYNSSSYFGEWYGKLNQKKLTFLQKSAAVPIDTAIRDLESRLMDYSHHAFSQTSIL